MESQFLFWNHDSKREAEKAGVENANMPGCRRKGKNAECMVDANGLRYPKVVIFTTNVDAENPTLIDHKCV